MSTHDGFEIRENADGTHTLLDVPVFFECKSDFKGREHAWDADYIKAAFDRLREWEEVDGHFPPMTEGHRTKERPEPRGVGWFRASRLGTYRGALAIFADLTYTDQRAWEDVLAMRRPYRSAEASFPGEGDPEIDSLALLETAPRLQMPMTKARMAGAMTGALAGAGSRASLSPVATFAADAGRCYLAWESPVTEAVKPARRARLSGVTGQFAAEVPPPKDGERPAGEEKPSVEPKPDPIPKGDEPKAGGGGLSDAIALLTQFMSTPVPLQDMVAAITMLESKLAQLKKGMGDTGGEQGEEDEPGQDPAEVAPPPASEDPAEPNGRTKPPPGGREPMNMSADPKAGADEAARMAKFEAEQAALRGEVDEFRTEQKRERAIFAAIKDLSDFNIGGDPEAKVREVVTKAGANWETALATFAATSKDLAPKRTGRGVAASVAGGIPDSDYPEEVRKLCKTPDEAAAGLAAFAAWKSSRDRGLFTSIPFESYFKTNRAHFGAPVA